MAIAASPISDSPEARRYNRISRQLSVADAVLGLLLLLVLLLTGLSKALSHLALVITGQSYVLALFVYVVALLLLGKIASIGLDYYGFRLEHQYHLSNQKLGSWAWDQLKGFLIGVVFSTVLAQLLYSLIRLMPQVWWIVAWAAFLALFIFLAQLAPVTLFPLFYKFRPLNNDTLRERLTSLSERAGTRVRGVYEWELSAKSTKANAALTGLGATRRIILADTLLAHYSDDEIEAVLAHELGHHVHKHIFKSILVHAVVTFIGFWAVKSVLRYAVIEQEWFGSQYDFSNLPLIVLVTSVISLLLMPVLNGYSRLNEREADRYAWKSIASVEPFVSAMNKLAEQNLAERNPSRWVEVLFHSHPSISRRVSAAEAWARSRR
ncbi:MAG TPA: M48 family metallopeptidase [Clostridia bacterium]|nr:M48 family metallopeptidase [Clostridia bacterium]